MLHAGDVGTAEAAGECVLVSHEAAIGGAEGNPHRKVNAV
jgi:hypothetical protein